MCQHLEGLKIHYSPGDGEWSWDAGFVFIK